jgi:hypothetical protein
MQKTSKSDTRKTKIIWASAATQLMVGFRLLISIILFCGIGLVTPAWAELTVSRPYQELLKHPAKSTTFKEWQWSLTEQIPGYQTLINPKAKVLSVLPEFSEWSVVSSKKSPLVQQWVDQAFSLYFSIPKVNEIFCYLYSHSLSLMEFGGVSVDKAIELMNSCRLPKEQMQAIGRVQSFTKEYLFIFNPLASEYLRTESIRPASWTDTENLTYIFLTPEMTYTDLVLSILHEVAIQSDQKSQLMPTTHLMLTGVGVNEEEELALRLASLNSINLTFSTLRALALERLLFVNGDLQQLSSQEQTSDCEVEFRKTYRFVKKLADRYTKLNQSSSFASGIYQLVADNVAEFAQSHGFTSEEKVLEYIFKAKIRYQSGILFDSETSFCEYMRTPHLSKHKHRTMAGHGPRPPIVGGAVTGTDKESLRDLSLKVERLFSHVREP